MTQTAGRSRTVRSTTFSDTRKFFLAGTATACDGSARRTIVTKEELLKKMKELGACDSATEYVTNHPSDDALEIGVGCGRQDWLLWFLVRVEVDCQDFALACADRAVRQYAPVALDRAGLAERACQLQALPEVDSRAAADAAADAARAARAAARAEAADARAAAYACTEAAYACAEAAYTRAEAYAARADAASDAAAYAARAAYYAAADAAHDAERALQLADLHVLWALVVA